MGSRAGPNLLRAATWFSWFRSDCLLRLFGLPAALLVLYLEVHGSSPASTSLILTRLARRLRLSTIACMLKKGSHGSVNSVFSPAGADVMDRPQGPRESRTPAPRRKSNRSASRKRSAAALHKEQAALSGLSGAAAALSLHTLQTTTTPQPPPRTTAPDSLPAASTVVTPKIAPPPPSPQAAMPLHTRSRTLSQAHAVSHGKRLSLQFPIQPASGSSSPGFSPRSRPQSWVATPSPMAAPALDDFPSDDNFLAVLAAQERYVLELREELAKAEEDLKTVKKHWAKHQSIKQRNDHRKITQLQPLSSLANVRPDPDDEDGSTLWMQKEMERRKALLSGTKTSQRKVFSGSRHLRTLSLLSPDKHFAPSFPQPLDARRSEDGPTNTYPQALARPSTAHTLSSQVTHTANSERYDLTGLSNIQRDAILRTGKQLATDFKDGLLTFFDDIKQATVGDEAMTHDEAANAQSTSAKGARNQSAGRPSLQRAASTKKASPERAGDIADAFWKEHGLSEPKTAPTNKKTHAIKHTQTPQQPAKEEEFDEWDSWDTPADKHLEMPASEFDESDEPSSPVSGQASSRTSTSTRYHSKRHDSKASSLTTSSSAGHADDGAFPQDSKRNSIPWPDLVKLSPTNLKRTASHLMKEWEKNLTPPPEARLNDHSSGDYIGRSASPAGLPKTI